MADPHNLEGVDRLERATGLNVRPVLALRNAIEELIPKVYGEGFQVESLTADMERDAVALGDEVVTLDLESLSSTNESSPVINLVNYMILQAVRQRASDIHVEASPQHSIVRFRVDGMLREVLRPRREFHPAIVSRLKVMAKMDIAEHRMPQDGRIHVVVDQRQIDLRVSTLPTVLGEKAVLRILDRASVTFRLDELGIPDAQFNTLKQLVSKPNGMLLVTGPTGSGKTTTLYSVIELLKSVERNIVTVEDPVEYRLENINQVHANAATQMTFAKALRAILRQDPDIIMIGEIRDAETAETAVQAALTGHLVLSTLHTNDSASAVTRLVDLGIAPFKISASLLGVVAQRLAHRVVRTAAEVTIQAGRSWIPLATKVIEIVPLLEVMVVITVTILAIKVELASTRCCKLPVKCADLINKGAPVDSLRDCAIRNGCSTLAESAIRLAEDGVTSLDEILRVAVFE